MAETQKVIKKALASDKAAICDYLVEEKFVKKMPIL